MPKEIEKITKHWPIHKIIELIPGSVELMMEIGLHCFSCSARMDERLNDGMQSHGFTDEDTNELVDKLNELLAQERTKKRNTPTDQDSICQKIEEANKTYYRIAGLLFTEFAYNTLHEMLENFKGLQIRLDAGGCSGYSYTYDFTNQPQTDESTYPMSDKLSIYMNDFTFDKLCGTVVDFKIGIKDAGLKFSNPNTKDSCHCGTSVGF